MQKLLPSVHHAVHASPLPARLACLGRADVDELKRHSRHRTPALDEHQYGLHDLPCAGRANRWRGPPRIKDLELDEFRSFVKDKSCQCWCRYGLNRATTRIAAYVFGRRTDRSCRQLVEKLSDCAVAQFSSADWHSYAKTLPPERYPFSNAQTLNIERHNLKLPHPSEAITPADDLLFEVLGNARGGH